MLWCELLCINMNCLGVVVLLYKVWFSVGGMRWLVLLWIISMGVCIEVILWVVLNCCVICCSIGG